MLLDYDFIIFTPYAGSDSPIISSNDNTYKESTKEGKIFAGWNTEADGSGTGYVDMQVVKNLSEKNADVVKLYAKLPDWFKVPTPLGSYNPDWAVLLDEDGCSKLYFVLD